MNNHPPGYLVPYILSGTVAVIATVLFGLDRALKLAGWPAQNRKRAFWSGAVLLFVWCFAALLLSWLGFFRGSTFRLPTIQYGLLIPIIAGVVLFRRWPLAQCALEAVPQEWIVSVQAYRVLGLIFLVLYASGRAPGAFAWPAGVGDITVGLLAPAVGIAYARRARNAGALVRAWNLFGIGDLIVAVTTGFLSSPSPLQLFGFDTPNELISQFPLAMIPVFLVPLSILLHLASLKKLRQTETRWQAWASASPVASRTV